MLRHNLNESFFNRNKIWRIVSELFILSRRSIWDNILSKMVILIHFVNLAVKEVDVHWSLLKHNFYVGLEITDNSCAVLLAIVIKPALLLLLLKIVVAPLRCEARDLSLLLQESHELYNGRIGLFVHAFELTSAAIVLELKVFQEIV